MIEIETLQSIKNDLKELAMRTENLPEPEKGIFESTLYITIKKVDSLLLG